MKYKLLPAGLMVFALAAPAAVTTITGLSSKTSVGVTAMPDPTIAVGTLEFCEHVNSAYQCWYKGGANAFKPVSFFGNTSPKADKLAWTQNSNNQGNTPNCSAPTPNAQLLHDNV
jgi:hypothetical protein